MCNSIKFKIRKTSVKKPWLPKPVKILICDFIKSKEEIIKLLTEQNDFIIQIISFTRRLATNSELTTMDETEIDLFRRNVYYLINQFKERQTKLIATEQFEDKQVNLIPIPQIFE